MANLWGRIKDAWDSNRHEDSQHRLSGVAGQDKPENRKPSLHYRYLEDGMKMAARADGPVSFYTQNSSGVPLYTTVPDPAKSGYQTAQTVEGLHERLRWNEDYQKEVQRFSAPQVSIQSPAAELAQMEGKHIHQLSQRQGFAAPAERERTRYEVGYQAMTERLDRQFNDWLGSRSQSEPDVVRGRVKDLAISASRSVVNDWGDRGAGPEYFEVPEYRSGERNALRDWSHSMNRSLKEQKEQQRSVTKGASMADQTEAQQTAIAAATEQKLAPQEERRMPPAQMSTQQIMTETRELHSEYKALYQEFETANTPAQRQEIRQEMAPIVARENELRTEYGNRVSPEISRDRVPEQSVRY